MFPLGGPVQNAIIFIPYCMSTVCHEVGGWLNILAALLVSLKSLNTN